MKTAVPGSTRRHARAALGFLALAAAGCGGGTTHYAYFKVHVALDPATVDEDHRREIIGCGVKIGGALSDSFSLPEAVCSKGSVKYDVGLFEYATTVAKGDVTFTVTMSNIKRQPVATGMSAALPITPDKTVDGEVILMGTAPDGGAPDADSDDASDGN